MNYIRIKNKEYKQPAEVAEYLCSLNTFTEEEKNQIRQEVNLYPYLVESRKLIFATWFWQLVERTN